LDLSTSFFHSANAYHSTATTDIRPPQPHISGKYLRSSYSDVLLEITPIEKPDDIHFIVGKVKDRAHTILAKNLPPFRDCKTLGNSPMGVGERKRTQSHPFPRHSNQHHPA